MGATAASLMDTAPTSCTLSPSGVLTDKVTSDGQWVVSDRVGGKGPAVAKGTRSA